MPRKSKPNPKVIEEINIIGVLKEDQQKVRKIAIEMRKKQVLLQKMEREQLLHDKRPLSYSNGYTIVPNDLITATDLTDGAKMTYINLLRYAWGTKTAWPSEARQADERGISTRQIQRHITMLSRRGYLWIELVIRKGQRYYNRYKLNIDDNSRKM